MNTNSNYPIVISAVILSAAIIFSAIRITDKIYQPSPFPSSLAVTTYDGDKNTTKTGDFITFYDAAAYLKLDDVKLKALIASGKLNGTFTSYISQSGDKTYVFSSAKLSEWMMKAIANGEEIM